MYIYANLSNMSETNVLVTVLGRTVNCNILSALKSPTIPIVRDVNAVGDDSLMTDND